jgi:hypothetical protein
VAFLATVIPVMLASPGDVAAERDVVRSVIHDWNDVNASASRIMLNPVGWETHSSPELGARPQELINSRLLETCDLLVGVFWTRLGTPTGDSASGTVEEIERHVEAGKPAMIYFSSKPVAPQSIDAEQFALVQGFKRQLMPRGLVESFDDIEQFRVKFSKQLQLCLVNNPYLNRLTQLPRLSNEDDSPDGGAPKILMSEEARNLLKAAAENENGTILKIALLGGTEIHAGHQTYGGGSARAAAKWEYALNELVQLGLVVARGSKDQVFELTHKGWELIDAL